jgi:hypothetical protein
MANVYVYYRLADAACAAARPLARDVLAAELDCARVALMQRPESSDGIRTWMECYEGAADPLELIERANRRSDAVGLSALLQGPRHCEVFEDLPCA